MKRLGLLNTGVYRGKAVIPQQTTPYRIGRHGVEAAQRSKHFGENAGGGLYSNPHDLYKFVLAIEKNILISKELTELMLFPHFKSGNKAEAYGWSIQQFGEQTIYLAAGSGYGTKSVVMRSPKQKDFIAITSNWGETPIFPMLLGMFLIINSQEYNIPTNDNFPDASKFQTYIGKYEFNKEEITKHLMMESAVVSLQIIEGKLFLDNNLLEKKADGALGLTYTNEVNIRLSENTMIMEINGNTIKGVKQT